MRSLHTNISAIRTKDQKSLPAGEKGKAPDIKSKSIFVNQVCFQAIILNITNEFYKNSKGEKVQNTQWHNIVAWGKTAEIVEQYVGKGKEIAIEGKLSSRSYETNEGEKRYVTEVVAKEILLLGNAKNAEE